jgi:N-acylneuraminate cytidylyltransferase
MKTVALILARGGSKGIPNKNLQLLGGLPLIEYTINAAKYSNVDEVWVSTDSVYIKTICKSLGANVIDRPDNLAKDTSPSEEALLHFAENEEFDTLVFIQPTSPLLRPAHINSGIDMMKEYDSVFSAYKEHWLPRWNLDVSPSNFNNNERPRRQDREDVYVENGAFYITTKKNLLDFQVRVSGKIGVYEMTFQDSFQVDTWEDLKLLEKLV